LSISAGFKAEFSPKDKVTLEFGITLRLKLVVSQPNFPSLNFILGLKLRLGKFGW